MPTFIQRFKKIELFVDMLCQGYVSLDYLCEQLPYIPKAKLIKFLADLVYAKEKMILDKEFLFSFDPSIDNIDYINTYTSVFAVSLYRIANIFPDKVIARQITEYAKSRSGIDIHPEAKIGVPFAIDHGVGTVIGQTTVIGDRCLLYHGVTLGAKHLHNRDQYGIDRHPKIGDDVIIYSNTTILGNIKIPSKSIVYANLFIKTQADVEKLVVSPEQN